MNIEFDIILHLTLAVEIILFGAAFENRDCSFGKDRFSHCLHISKRNVSLCQIVLYTWRDNNTIIIFFFLNKRKVIQFAYTYIHIYTCTNKEPIFRLASRSYTVCQLKLNILNKNIERSAILINKANVLLACLNDIFCFVCDVFLNYIHLQIRINDSFPWHAAVLVEYEEWKGYVLDVCDYSCVYNMCCNKK